MLAAPTSALESNLELDELAVQLLDVSEQLMRAKLELETRLRRGFLCLAESRKSLGQTRVSRLQLPTEAWPDHFTARAKVRHCECVRSENSVRFNVFTAVDADAGEDGSAVGDGNNGGAAEIVHRKKKSEQKGASNVSRDDENKMAAAADVGRPKTVDPIRWFGVLVPQKLRQGQRDFVRSIELTLECANLTAEIGGVIARIKFVRRIRAKFAALAAMSQDRAAAEDQAAVTEDRAATTEDRAVIQEDQATTAEDQATTAEDRAVATEDRAAATEDQAVTAEDRAGCDEDAGLKAQVIDEHDREEVLEKEE